MNGRQRMRAALAGEAVDRPGLAYQFFGAAHHVLDVMGMSMLDVYAHPDSIASAQIAAAELFGHDSAMAPWGCLTVEAEAFGCELETFDMWYPQVRYRPLVESTDLTVLPDVGPSLAGRMPLMVEALAELRSRTGNDLFIIGTVVSPFLVACELREMSNLLMDLGRDPAFACSLLETVTDGLLPYIDAMAATGACDALMFENAGMSAELLGPHHVEAFVRPYHRWLVDHARSKADWLLIEHNCGVNPYFEEIQNSAVDAVSFATSSLAEAVEPAASERGLAGIGMVDHAELLLRGSPMEVYEAALSCIGQAEGRPFVLSTGCEIPFKAPIANVRALADAAQAFA